MANQNKGGRPRKKPGYDKDKEVQRLIDRAVRLYGDPYDDRDERPETSPTLQSVAEEMGTTTVRVRKILITAGCYTTAQSRRVQDLHRRGYSIEEIGELTGLGPASVHSYLPYRDGMYKLDDPTLRAERGRSIRKRIKACERLVNEKNEENLWKAVLAFEGYIFRDEGKKCRYRIENENLVFSQIRISKELLMSEFHRIVGIRGKIDKTQCIECIYMVFTRLGVCEPSDQKVHD